VTNGGQDYRPARRLSEAVVTESLPLALIGMCLCFILLGCIRLVQSRRWIFKSLFRVVLPPKTDLSKALVLAKAQYEYVYQLYNQTAADPTRTRYEAEQYGALLHAVREDVKTLEEIASGKRAEDDTAPSDEDQIKRIARSIRERDTGALPEVRCMTGYNPSSEQLASDTAATARVDRLVARGYTASVNEEGGLVLSPEDSSENSEPAEDIDRLLGERLELLAPEGRAE
jgi:hypothetical protein